MGSKLRTLGARIGWKARERHPLKSRSESSRSHSSWSESLRRVRADLELLNHNTEQDFLKIGTKLAGFMEAVNLISSELSALAGLITGEQGRGASDALTAALDLSAEIGKRSENGKGELAGMRQEADRFRRTLAEFQKTISRFHTLEVLTRMETVRLRTAGSDFGNLADDMKSLAGEVHAHLQSALDMAALLIIPMENALRDIRALEEGPSRDLPAVMSRVQANLSSFRKIQERVHGSVLRLRTKSDAISAAFTKVVISIQFHDITRQQVEHVVEVLGRLSEAPSQPKGAAAALKLQSSQLADAARKFGTSVASVGSNLDEVAAHVLEMVEESQTLSNSSALEKDSFLLPMAQGCTAILDNLTLCGETETAVEVISSRLSEPIGRMRESIEGIQEIEIQMRRMALNANIRAAHIGVAGNALIVLSGNMQELAGDCAQRTGCLLEGLGSMRSAAIRLSGQRESSAVHLRGDQERCMNGLRAAVADLHSSSESSLVQTALIADGGARLREELAATRESFSIGVLFSEAICRARASLDRIAGEIQETPESHSLGGGAEALEEFATNYTMQSERDVFQNAAVPASDAASPRVEPSESLLPEPGQEPGDAGGDVEFF